MRFKLIALLLAILMVLPMVAACSEPTVENTPAEDKVPGAGELTETPDAVEKADVVAALLKELLAKSQGVSSEKVEIKGKYKGSITSSFLTPKPENIYSSDEWVEFDVNFLNAFFGGDVSAPTTEVLKNLILGGAYADGDEFVAGLANSLDFSKIEAEYGSLDNFITASSASTVCLAIVSAIAGSEGFADLSPELQEYVLTLSKNATDFALKLANGTADFETFFDFILPDSEYGYAVDVIRSTWDGEGNENLEVYFEAFKEYIPMLFRVIAMPDEFIAVENLYIVNDIAIEALTEYLGSENGPFAKGDFAGVLTAFYAAAASTYPLWGIDSLLFNATTYFYDMVNDCWYDYYMVPVTVPDGYEFVVENVSCFFLDVDDTEYRWQGYSTYEEACEARDALGFDCAIMQECSVYIVAEGSDRATALESAFDDIFGTVTGIIDEGEYDNDTKLALVLGALTYVISDYYMNDMYVEDNMTLAGYANHMFAFRLMMSVFGEAVADGMDDAIDKIYADNKIEALVENFGFPTVEALYKVVFGDIDSDSSTVDVFVKSIIYILNENNVIFDNYIFIGLGVSADLAEFIEKIYNGDFNGEYNVGVSAIIVTAATWFACKDAVDAVVDELANRGYEDGYISEDEIDEYKKAIKTFVMTDLYETVFNRISNYVENVGSKPELDPDAPKATLNVLEVLGFIYASIADAKAESDSENDANDPNENLNMIEGIGAADTYFFAMIACDILEPLHRAKAEMYVDADAVDYEEAISSKIKEYEDVVIYTVVSLFGKTEMLGVNIFLPAIHIYYILDAYEYEPLMSLCMQYGVDALDLFEDEYMLGGDDAAALGATEYITVADVGDDVFNKKAYVLGYNAYVDGTEIDKLRSMSLAEVYEYVYLPFIFEAETDDGTVLGELIFGFYYTRNMAIEPEDAEAYALAIRNVYTDAVNNGMTAAETINIVAYYVYNHAANTEEGSVADTFIKNMVAIAEIVSDEEFEFSKKAMYAVMLKQFYGENEYVDAVIELLGKPGEESVRANLKLLVSLLIDDSKGDIFVDIAIAAFTGDKAELLALLEELSGVEDYQLGATTLALIAHYLGQFGSIDEDIATIIEAYQIFGFTTEMLEELFGEVLYPDFSEVIEVISNALKADKIDPVHLALDIMVAEGVFDGVSIPDKSYEYYYEELIALIGAFNVFMRQGLNFYDAKNCANVTLLVLSDLENIEDYALRLLTVEEKLFEAGSSMWIIYALLSTKAHLDYEDASIVDWERVLDYIEILVPEMTIQNYPALANLLRDAAETIVTDIKTDIALDYHSELETAYTYTIVGTVSAEGIFTCELNIVLEMLVSNV